MREYNTEQEFGTRKEAEAFVVGVEYVNDSALHVVDIVIREGKYIVLLQDYNRVA